MVQRGTPASFPLSVSMFFLCVTCVACVACVFHLAEHFVGLTVFTIVVSLQCDLLCQATVVGLLLAIGVNPLN